MTATPLHILTFDVIFGLKTCFTDAPQVGEPIVAAIKEQTASTASFTANGTSIQAAVYL